MARVFISYARKDFGLAAAVHRWLAGAAHEAFLDQDRADGIRAGEDWQDRLHERLRWADVVVCLVSAASVASTWCVAEVATALSRGSRLIPIQVEAGARHPLVTRIQHVDLDGGLETARTRLLDELRVVDAAGGSGWPDNRSPFPGLLPFDTDQHGVFFGRSSEVTQLATLLRSPAERLDGGLLLVVGPSGCGKSSLVRAGLLAAMAAEREWWVVAPVLPGNDPVAALTRELTAGLCAVGRDVTISEVRTRLDQDGLSAVVDDLLVAAPGSNRRRLLVVIDQFEELLTQSPNSERSRFLQLLRPALRGPLQVVATLRPEYLDPLLLNPELAGLGVGTRPFPVRPLPRDILPEVIEQPARLAGIIVDEGLVPRLVADTDGGGALPLLAYTLQQLAEDIGRGGRLRLSRYEQLGGVHGTLTRQSDAALAEIMTRTGQDRDQVLRTLLRLVTVDEEGRPTRLRVPRAELPATLVAMWEPFVARRLLTTDHDGDRDVVEVAHEAFLSAWAPLATIIADNATALRARRRIEQAATEWSDQGEPAWRLWERGQLASALIDTGARLHSSTNDGGDRSTRLAWWPYRRQNLTTDRVELSLIARRFLRVSMRHDRTRRSRIIIPVGLVALVAAVALGATGGKLQSAAMHDAAVASASTQVEVAASRITAGAPPASVRDAQLRVVNATGSPVDDGPALPLRPAQIRELAGGGSVIIGKPPQQRLCWATRVVAPNGSTLFIVASSDQLSDSPLVARAMEVLLIGGLLASVLVILAAWIATRVALQSVGLTRVSGFGPSRSSLQRVDLLGRVYRAGGRPVARKPLRVGGFRRWSRSEGSGRCRQRVDASEDLGQPLFVGRQAKH